MNEMRKLMEAVDATDLEDELDNLKRRFAEILSELKVKHPEDDAETMFSHEMEMFQSDVHDYLDNSDFFEDDDDDDWRTGAGNPRFMDDDEDEDWDDEDEYEEGRDSAINSIIEKSRR